MIERLLIETGENEDVRHVDAAGVLELLGLNFEHHFSFAHVRDQNARRNIPGGVYRKAIMSVPDAELKKLVSWAAFSIAAEVNDGTRTPEQRAEIAEKNFGYLRSPIVQNILELPRPQEITQINDVYIEQVELREAA